MKGKLEKETVCDTKFMDLSATPIFCHLIAIDESSPLYQYGLFTIDSVCIACMAQKGRCCGRSFPVTILIGHDDGWKWKHRHPLQNISSAEMTSRAK